jgi:uncharacterized protein (DUF1810 family)
MAEDPYDLQRFVSAQDRDGTFERAMAELQRGRKTSHWMWFVFPQIAGLGNSPMARKYAISSLDEARAYWHHPILGERLRRSVKIVATGPESDVVRLFGVVDALKLRSSMTLFLRATPDEPLWAQVLDRYFDAVPDPETEARLVPGHG